MRVIFLDIDGVLNSEAYFTSLANPPVALDDEIDPCAVRELNKLVARHSAVVVLSSDWRKTPSKPGLAATNDALLRQGASFELLAATPELTERERQQRFGVQWQGSYTPRGLEIQAWLTEHSTVSHFVILDDEPDMEHLVDYLVQTDQAIGLTPEDCDRASAILDRLPR